MQFEIVATSITGPGLEDAHQVRRHGDAATLATVVGEAAVQLAEFEVERVEVVATPVEGGRQRVLGITWSSCAWSDSGQRVQVQEMSTPLLA